MGNKLILGEIKNDIKIKDLPDNQKAPEKIIPGLDTLKVDLEEAGQILDDVIMKKYLYSLNTLKIVPLSREYMDISRIRLFRITEMVYQNSEYSTLKFSSVFNAVQNLNCNIFVLIDSDGKKTEFYMGVRSLDNKRTTKSLKDTLKNALSGQFPGVQMEDLLDEKAEKIIEKISSENIASVSCVANNKDSNIKDDRKFIQGLEKLALAMQGQKYKAVILASGVSSEKLDETRNSYENIYTKLSPFENMQMSYGKNEALSVSEAFSHSTSDGTSKGVSAPDKKMKITSIVTSGLALAASFIPYVGAGIGDVIGDVGRNIATAQNKTQSDSTNNSVSEGTSHSESTNSGTSESIQLTVRNKNFSNMLERINTQLKRIDECESIGMWECAAYFTSDNQETTEMAAGTYKALMKGERSGVETSAINYWGHKNKELPALCSYIKNFMHPVFLYEKSNIPVPVSPASLISSNELAIHMGLPRKSVCGFPVVEHADFGKEVVSVSKKDHKQKDFTLGHIFSMGEEKETEVRLDSNSLTMHTFVTGSTGSGKSNTVYEILYQLGLLYKIPFLVIEPAKGEYKNVFGNDKSVHVYGTNPKKTQLLKINPFSFNEDIHILEHLDRLVEIFNVCWPMYAAMPAVLKDSIERAYTSLGWDIINSENPGGRIFPNFADILKNIDAVVSESGYSADTTSDYKGSLSTRVRSLTTGLNGQIFSGDEISESELFDRNVIIDLSRVGSSETKSLIMGLLVMKLNEYRMASGKINSELSHITVLEEAHNILKRTSFEQSAEGSNLTGKSVEMLANSIAEMRTYGEGFIIADQSPGLLDMSAIRNTNTKIILRLPDNDDRKLVGYSAGLNEEQIKELSKLKRGVGAVYQNDWVEPVLAQISKCPLRETPYSYFPEETEKSDFRKIRSQIVYFLLRDPLGSNEFDFTYLGSEYNKLPLPAVLRAYIKNSIERYKGNDTAPENYTAGIMTDIIDVRKAFSLLMISPEAVPEEKNPTHEQIAGHLTSLIIRLLEKHIDTQPLSRAKIKALITYIMADWINDAPAGTEKQARIKIFNLWNNFYK